MRPVRIVSIFFSLLPALALAQGNAPAEVKLQVVTVPDPAKTAKPAFARKVTDLQTIPDDFWTFGTYGDIQLGNDFASFVFGSAEKKESEAIRKGAILDAFSSPATPECLELFRPILDDKNPQSTVVETMDSSENKEAGSAWVTTFAKDANYPGLSIDTTYEMQRGWHGMLATTTVTNDSQKEVKVPVLGDYAGWGAMGVFLPGQGWLQQKAGFKDIEFMFARLFDTIIFVSPKSGLFEVRHDLRSSMLIYRTDVTLKPGEAASYQRWILVGQQDPAALYSFTKEELGPGKFGYIAGTVQERVALPDGTVQETNYVGESELRLAAIVRDDLPKSYVGKPYIYTMTDKNGHYQLSLPPGDYSVFSAHPARIYQPSSTAIRVRPKQVSGVDQAVSRASGVVYEVVDSKTNEAIPCKLTFLPLRGTNEADFGPLGRLQSFHTVYARNGKGIVDVPAGNYRVVASRGNEYHSQEQRVVVNKLETATIKFKLERAFETPGWVAADLAVMTNNSPHSRTTPEDRVVSAAAEGLDWIVSADPGKPTDLQPYIERLGLASTIRASQGFRLTNSLNHKRGDYLLFPVEFCGTEGKQPDFSLVQDSASPREAIDGLRALCSGAMLVAMRPVFPDAGLLAVQGYDFMKDGAPKADLTLDVDGFQVWDGKRQSIVTQTLDVYQSLLQSGIKMSLLGASLSTGTFNEEPGYPRVYIRSTQDAADKLDVKELVRNLKANKVQVTNGPFIDFKINGKDPGATVAVKDGTVDVDLKVFSPGWSNVATVSLVQNGRMVRQIMLPAGSVDTTKGQVYPTADKPEDGKFKLRATEDSIVYVLVEGDQSLTQDPVNPLIVPTTASDVMQGQRTLAFTAPLLLDVDGNGKYDKPKETPKADTPQDNQVAPF